MGKYAVTSQVPVNRTKADIEDILSKYGAEAFSYATDGRKASIVFRMRERMLRFDLPLPSPMDFTTDQKYGQAMRSCWRSLLLIIRAKLEAVESEIVDFQSEFLAQMVLPNKMTMGEFVRPQLEAAYKSGEMPPMLPWEGGG